MPEHPKPETKFDHVCSPNEAGVLRCPSCGKTLKIRDRTGFRAPRPRRLFVLGLLLILANILVVVYLRKSYFSSAELYGRYKFPADKIISYINSRNPDPSCDTCVEAAKRDIEEKMAKDMVLIPAGAYSIGSPKGEGNPDEWPRHKVHLDAFYIDKYEVTNRRYLEFVTPAMPGMTGGNYPEWLAPGSDFNVKTGSNPYYRKMGKALKSGNNPVVGITWNDANAYCRWLEKRLPTEAEWEAAAHGGMNTRYHFGNDRSLAREYSWNKLNSSEKTHPVGSKKPNQYGIYDMHGNVWEWVSDFYDKDYYASSSKSNPTGPKKGKERGIRGGSWTFATDAGRPANRASYEGYKANDDIGFRCAVSRVTIR